MAGDPASPGGAHDPVANPAAGHSASATQGDQHASVSSQSSDMPTANAVLIDDEPGEGYGTIESVPGFDVARSLERVRADAAAPEAWDNFGHFDEERPRAAGAQDDSDFGFADYDASVAQVVMTATPPWQWLCQLVVKNADGTRSLGTGWLVSPHVVITAGRCVYDPDAAAWAREIEVIPGLDGARRPWGAVLSQTFRSVRGWFDNQDPDFDYGCIILPDGFSSIGHFGLANLPSAALTGQVLNYAGYPADKPRGTQWFDACRMERPTERRVSYRGQSDVIPVGSPLWLQMRRGGRAQRLVCAIGGSRGPAGSAIRLNAEMLNRIKEWKEEAVAAKPNPSTTGAGAQNGAAAGGAAAGGQGVGNPQGGAAPG